MPAGSTSTHYSARFLSPDLLERERDNALSCPVYSGGALVPPASGTVTVQDQSGEAIVDGAAVTITGDVATYTVTAATLPDTVSFAEGWMVEWALVASGITRAFRNDAALVRNALYPVVTDIDLFRRVSALDPNGNDPITSLTDFQDYLDEAWATIQNRLIARGNRPNLIMSPSSFREAHVCLTLALVFDDLKTRLNPAFAEQARDYRDQYTAAWNDLRFVYDSDEDGIPDDTSRKSVSPTIWLCGR